MYHIVRMYIIFSTAYPKHSLASRRLEEPHAVVSVFGSGGKLAVFLLWREIFITTGKKKIFGGGKVLFRPEKKFYLSILLWRKSFITTGKKSSSRDFYAKLNVSNLKVTNLY